MSEGTPVSSIPRWAAFPVLRLAALVRLGIACRELGVSSVRVPMGGASLLGPAFATPAGRYFADETAGYVVCGRVSANLGAIGESSRALCDAVVDFRSSIAGAKLRGEIASRLDVDDGADFGAAVNAGLTEAVPARFLEEARNEFMRVLAVRGQTANSVPAAWCDSKSEDLALRKWRARVRKQVEKYVELSGADPYGNCPCGSGEQLKFCCLEASRDN